MKQISFPKHLKKTVSLESVESLLGELFYQTYTIQLSSGITNKLIKATSLAEPKVVLIRLYGNKTELMIDRQKEIEYLCYLHECGEAPPIYYTFDNGLMYGYQEGFPLISFAEQDTESLASSADGINGSMPDLPLHVMKLVIQKMARFHSLETIEKTTQFDKTMRKWLGELNQSFRICDLNLHEELIFLNSILPKDAVNSHNDLLLGNIILEPQGTSYVVHFIDFEYAFANCRAFDMANFLNELCGFECIWSKIPKKEVIMELIVTYLTEANLKTDPNEFYAEIKVCFLASHYLWGLWAIIQSDVSELDFDYKEYSEKRLSRYRELKDEYLQNSK